MHPVDHRYFGRYGVAIWFNTEGVVRRGFIVRQVGTTAYIVSDNTSVINAHIRLSQTLGATADLRPGEGTIVVSTPDGDRFVSKLMSRQAIILDADGQRTIRKWTTTPNEASGEAIILESATFPASSSSSTLEGDDLLYFNTINVSLIRTEDNEAILTEDTATFVCTED